MKHIKLTLAALSATVMMACGENKKAESQEPTAKDSTNVNANTPEESAKTDAEPAVEVPFQTPDLTLFELVGHVKTCKYGSVTLKFDNEGKLTSYVMGGLNQIKQIERDKENRIIHFISAEDEETGSQNEGLVEWAANGNVKQFVEVNMEGSIVYEYTYTEPDAQNPVARIAISTQKGEGYNWSGTTTYTYDSFDEVGNWTQRKGKADLYCDYDGHNEEKETNTTKRVITYY
ncbi:MAG: hypothetical protein MJZ60_07965 [Bacteroidaceae bacterium]|nr:hypothetical protein [Bacteroidaceae bacterium]